MNIHLNFIQSPAIASKVLVFRTNIRFKKDVKQIAPVLNSLNDIVHWNVAVDDSDKVLRIVSFKLKANEIIETIKLAGYHCEELT